MKDTIIVRPERCIGCGVCIRSCPAPEANITKKLDNGKLITSVDPSKCIACGECIDKCTRGARSYVDDTDAFMTKLEEGKEMIVIVDPAIKALYPLLWTGILDWFKSKKCMVFDGAFGADIYVWAFLSLIESGKLKSVISQPCTSIMNYIKIYRPALMKNLAPIYSPSVCTAIYIKKYLKRENKIAVLTPCIAKKSECIETGMINYSITFKKLMDYFNRNDIYISHDQPDSYDYPYTDMQGQMGVLLSRPEGLKDNILQRKPEMAIEASRGVERVYEDLIEYEKQHEAKLPDVFDVLSCSHGCVCGHGAGNANYFDAMTNMRAIEAEAREKVKGKGRFRNTEDRLFKRFDEELDIDDYLRVYRPLKPPPTPTDVDIANAFGLLEKRTGVERTVNCGSCGYSTCREMAGAISKGLNVPEGCAEYRKKQAAAQPVSDEQVNGIIKECAKLSEQLEKDLGSVSGDIKELTAASDKLTEKTGSINELLKSLVAFCSKNTSMDENSLKQMIKILETTIKSLTTLEENAGQASSDTHAVSAAIEEVSRLIPQLKEKLSLKGNA